MDATLAPTDDADLIGRGLRVCRTAGLFGTEGRISARDARDPNVAWIAGSAYDLAAARPIDAGIEPPSEHWMHREIYRRRADVGAIVFARPATILALSAAGNALRQIVTVNPFIPIGGAPVLDSALPVTSEARGRALADRLGEHPILVIRRRGVVTVGGSVEEAVIRMICAEDNARVQARATQIGTPNFIEGSDVGTLRAENLDPKIIRKFWAYWESRAISAG